MITQISQQDNAKLTDLQSAAVTNLYGASLNKPVYRILLIKFLQICIGKSTEILAQNLLEIFAPALIL